MDSNSQSLAEAASTGGVDDLEALRQYLLSQYSNLLVEQTSLAKGKEALNKEKAEFRKACGDFTKRLQDIKTAHENVG